MAVHSFILATRVSFNKSELQILKILFLPLFINQTQFVG